MDSVDSVYDGFDQIVWVCPDCYGPSRPTMYGPNLPTLHPQSCPFCDPWPGICPDLMCGAYIRLVEDDLDPGFQGHQCHNWGVTYEP